MQYIVFHSDTSYKGLVIFKNVGYIYIHFEWLIIATWCIRLIMFDIDYTRNIYKDFIGLNKFII